jgi:hypothetical protein
MNGQYIDHIFGQNIFYCKQPNLIILKPASDIYIQKARLSGFCKLPKNSATASTIAMQDGRPRQTSRPREWPFAEPGSPPSDRLLLGGTEPGDIGERYLPSAKVF